MLALQRARVVKAWDPMAKTPKRGKSCCLKCIVLVDVFRLEFES